MGNYKPLNHNVIKLINVQGWRSSVKRDGLKIRWLRSTGVQKGIEHISLPACYQ